MPFKGDMRLGGRHSNVATLNGTSSDFDGVPAAGTVISVTDTSREEPDYAGVMFYMPYSTTVYHDGLGGQYSTETWGLQYLPAGWRTGTGGGGYQVQISELGGNYYTGGSVEFYYQEDGTGINYTGETISTSYYSSGTHIDGNYYWDGMGGYYYDPPPDYPSYGTWLGSSSGNINYETPDSPTCTFVVGSYSGDDYADGSGGSYFSGMDSYLPYGTLLGDCGDYTYYASDNGDPRAYRHFKQGYVINTSTSGENFGTYNYQTEGGTYLISATLYSEIADGMGGSSNSEYYPWYPSYGTVLNSGTYSYEYIDADGFTQYGQQNFNVLADGNGSYYIENT